MHFICANENICETRRNTISVHYFSDCFVPQNTTTAKKVLRKPLVCVWIGAVNCIWNDILLINQLVYFHYVMCNLHRKHNDLVIMNTLQPLSHARWTPVASYIHSSRRWPLHFAGMGRLKWMLLTIRSWRDHAEWLIELQHHRRCHCRRRMRHDDSYATIIFGHRVITVKTKQKSVILTIFGLNRNPHNTYLVTAFAIDGHNKTNAARFMLICWIIKTLCWWSFPCLLVIRFALVVINYASSWRWLGIMAILVRWRHLQLSTDFNRSLCSKCHFFFFFF